MIARLRVLRGQRSAPALLQRVPAAPAPRRSAHEGAVTRGGFASARLPA